MNASMLIPEHHLAMPSRRGALQAVLGASLILVSCQATTTTTKAPSQDDIAFARLFASLEIVGIRGSQAILDGLNSGRLGAAPPALLAFFESARKHHEQHLSQWNKFLAHAGHSPQLAPDGAVDSRLTNGLRQATDIGGVLALASTTEATLAQTIGSVADRATSSGLVTLIAETAPVEAQHFGVLQYFLGADLFIDVKVVNDLGRPASDLSSG